MSKIEELDYEKDYQEFWKEIVENEDGTLDIEQVKKELSDFKYFIVNIPKSYDNITDGYISKHMTNIRHIIDRVNKRIEDSYNKGYNDALEEFKQSLE